MIFQDLIEEGNDDLDRKIEAMKRGRREYASGKRYYKPTGKIHRPQGKSSKPSKPSKPSTNSRWIIPGKVMRACRPGYSDWGLDKEAVNKWIEAVKDSVGQMPDSIITFLTDEEIKKFYNFDLLSYYRELGFDVRHMPKYDPVYSSKKGPVFSFEDYQQIKKWIEELDKPVLIHCSAGVDRTGEVSQYLKHAYGLDAKSKQKAAETKIVDREKDEDGTERVTLKDGEVWERAPGQGTWIKLQKDEEPEDDSIQSQVDKFRTRYGGWNNVK